MKCPVDDETLVMAERNGVEIDYCPKCRGVWLDRGELDKIVERAAPEPSQPARDQSPPPRADHDRGHKPYRKKKKESFLSELFDF
ncbi:zf-TFIIB domain-containing protein [Kaustia mangrovi]|uniref:Zf-TFIIB domain-containing protein n=1 Tax=Kaustia mangrovi TaxID=2593653 RepID=A0A7S8C1L6_9HYPH|nr:zf-TFIIB domain-containing protein [Kaustia mangrovi]QPC41710.1 zf-TFIIB domain-containing protein [Kaustia mangrovi]